MADNSLNMHYDFKQKLNKVDSSRFASLKIPEIDWVLNEAQGLLIDMISFPRVFKGIGFEHGQKAIDDLNIITVQDFLIEPVVNIGVETDKARILLPVNYRHHLSSSVLCKKGLCERVIRTTTVQHDDKIERDPFMKSSFKWEEVNIKFVHGGISILTGFDFEVKEFYLSYLRTPDYIHAAGSFPGGKYSLPDGTMLTGYKNCELSIPMQKEIVDLAVLITTGNLMADYQTRQAKLQMSN